MEGFIVERLTKDCKVKAEYVESALTSVKKFAEAVNAMSKTGDFQVTFRDIGVTVSYLAVPNMPLPLWAFVRYSPSGKAHVTFYARDLSEEERIKQLDDAKKQVVLGGYVAAYFFDMVNMDIAEQFKK